MKLGCMRLLISCSFVFTLNSAFAQEHLPPANLLQKLSLKLRGKAPSATEVAEFKARIAQSPEKFQSIYQDKIADYIKSPEFKNVVEDFHGIWWRLPRNETTGLAGYIVTADRPYFELFNKNYLFVDGSRAEAYAAVNAMTEGPLPDAAGDWRFVRLSKNESRFRGMFSDLDFLNQYPDTPSNKNRTRSNYIFKTFLCEVLAPPAPPATSSMQVPFFHPHRQMGDGDEHGTNPDCIGCHYRLDPMARFFDHWRPPGTFSDGTWYDASQPAKGKVVLRDKDGTTQSSEGSGESDLAKILRSEPQVVQCLTKKTWEFVFGTGIKLAAKDHEQLIATFKTRENFKDLLVKIVNHPYFWSSAEIPPLRFDDIKSDLGMCAGCHKPGGDYEPEFDSLKYPFSSDPAMNRQLVKRIWGAINHRGGYAPMPKAPRPKLPDDTLSRIRDWISAGSIDNHGQATLNESQIAEVLDDRKSKN